jgi:DNA polymerase
MLGKHKDMTPEEAARALGWLVEMGADEIVGEQPVNRLVAQRPAEAPAAAKPAAGRGAQALQSIPAAPISAPPRDAFPGDAQSMAAACQTLADIAAALNQFDACPLKKTATQLCFSDGNPEADVMLVGEAPGRDEDLQGKPFVGRSGQLLDRMLQPIGLSRQGDRPDNSVFITNVIFWRPPGNRTPTEQETLMCMPFLRRAIEIQRPKVIVCLGATPTQRLTGQKDGILRLRGRWFAIDIDGRRIPLLATLHPAYLLRQPAQKRLAWRDLVSLKLALKQGFTNG